jgi:hypothetical protein
VNQDDSYQGSDLCRSYNRVCFALWVNLINTDNDSVLAGPIDTTEKSRPFKIGVTFHDGKETLYLTSTSAASPSVADGIECTITTTKSGSKSIGQLGCGPENKAFTYSELHTTEPLKPVASDNKNVDWSIGADDIIHWGALPTGTKSVTFSRIKGGGAKNIYAEVCSTYNHHDLFPGLGDFWERGVAKAYYI